MSKTQDSSEANVSKNDNVFTTPINSTKSNADTISPKLSKPTTDQSINDMTKSKYDYENCPFIANIINTSIPSSKYTQDSKASTISSLADPSTLQFLGKNSNITDNDNEID